MVTRTCCLSGALLSMRNSPQKPKAPLGGAQLIDLSQQLFNPAAHLLSLRLQGLNFIRQQRRLAPGLGGLFHRGFPLPAQPPGKLDGALYAIFQAAQRIAFLFGWTHAFSSRAARADSFTARADCASSARLRKAASSCSATSARTLRFKSIPAAFRPWINLL